MTSVVDRSALPLSGGSRVGVWPIVSIFVAMGTIVAIGAFLSVEFAALLFLMGTFALVSSKPALVFVVMLASAPFPNDVGGGPVNMAVSDLTMVVALAAFVATGKARVVANPLRWPVLVYFLICITSSVLNGVFLFSLASMVQMVLYLVIAVYVFSGCVRRPEDLYPALYAMIATDLLLVVAQFVTRSSFMFGLHKNALGTQMAFGVVVAVGLWLSASESTHRRRLAVVVGILAAGLVFSLSRGAWLGAACGILVIFSLRGRLGSSLKFAGMAAPVVIVCWMLLPEQSKEYATDLHADSHNIKARLQSIDYAMAYFKQSPVLGVGVGLRKSYDATNLVMSTLAETGLLGLVALSSFFVTLYWMSWYASRRLDRNDPAFPLLLAGIALVTCKLVHGLVDHYWGRGTTPAWAGAGLVVFAFGRARAMRTLQKKNPRSPKA